MIAAYVTALIAIVVLLGWHEWGKASARSAAELWLMQHHYRVRRIRAPFRPSAMFTSLFRETNTFQFEATVDDRDLRGMKKLLVRVWADRFGQLTGAIDVVTDWSAPTDESALLIAVTQIEILQRVAAGETGFYAPTDMEGVDEEFNKLVEHVVALSRRGMVICDAPTVDLRDSGKYVAIDKIMLTPAGKHWLESRVS